MARLPFVAALCWLFAFAGPVSAAPDDDGSGSGADGREHASAEMAPQADPGSAALLREQMALCSVYQNCDLDDMGDDPTGNERLLNWHRLAGLVDTDAITPEHLPDNLPPTPLSMGLRGEGWVPGPQDWSTAVEQIALCQSAGYERCDPSQMGYDVLENERQLELARCLMATEDVAVSAAAVPAAGEAALTASMTSDGTAGGDDQASEPADGSANRTDAGRPTAPQAQQAQPPDGDAAAEAERECCAAVLLDDPGNATEAQLASCPMDSRCPPPLPNMDGASRADLRTYLENVSRWLAANRQHLSPEAFEEVSEKRDQAESVYQEWILKERTAVNDAHTELELVERALQGLHETVQAVIG